MSLFSLTPAQDGPAVGNSGMEHSSLSTKVYQSLRAALADGELQPGQKLSVRLFTERLQVSQTPVREAMLQLVAERALTMSRNKSVTVPTLAAETFIELRDIRVALEGLACRCAAEEAQPQEIDALEALHQRMMAAKRAGDYPATLRLNREVHMGVCALGRRPELLALIESLWVRTGPYLNLIYGSRPAAVEPHEHERLFAALRKRNAEDAAASIAQDILHGGAPIVEALQSPLR